MAVPIGLDDILLEPSVLTRRQHDQRPPFVDGILIGAGTVTDLAAPEMRAEPGEGAGD